MVLESSSSSLHELDSKERGALIESLLAILEKGDSHGKVKKDIYESLFSFSKDKDPLLRYALAKAIACKVDVPHQLVVVLAHDQLNISAPVILNSPVLRDYDLMDLIMDGDRKICEIVASRPGLSEMVSSFLSCHANADSCIRLLRNPTALVSEATLTEIAERYVDDPAVHGALLERADLPIALRQRLIMTLCDAMIDSHTADDLHISPERMNRFVREVWEKMALDLINLVREGDHQILIEHLQASGKLSVGLLLRALVYGNLIFFESAIACLTGLPVNRVKDLVREYSGFGFFAVYRYANLPDCAYEGLSLVLRYVLQAQGRGENLRLLEGRRKFLEKLLDQYTSRISSGGDSILEYLLCLYDECPTCDLRYDSSNELDEIIAA